tara:strand:+ start:1156 stop:1440 length:285 start_codon:yes stop_codon:yes gene_type:complete
MRPIALRGGGRTKKPKVRDLLLREKPPLPKRKLPKKGDKPKYTPAMKKGGSTKDACYHKVKARYRVFPSAYASGAIAKCRKVGAANYGKGGKKK